MDGQMDGGKSEKEGGVRKKRKGRDGPVSIPRTLYINKLKIRH